MKKTRTRTTRTTTPATRPAPARPPDPRFERFWAAYPRQSQHDKARAQWDLIAPDDALLETMLQAIARQKDSRQWQEENGRFIPYPERWLREARWKDGDPAERRRLPDRREGPVVRTDLLEVGDVARALGESRGTTWRRIRRGDLKPAIILRSGRKIYAQEAVDKILAARIAPESVEPAPVVEDAAPTGE